MGDGRKNNGGARKGAGRKSKAEESKANTIMLQALKEIHSTSTDEETKIAFVKDLIGDSRGKMFVAEHVFGKAKDTVDNNMNFGDSGEVTIEFKNKRK